MSADRFAADPDRLGTSAQRLLNLQGRVQALSTLVDQLATSYPEAAGDGEFKESYDENYVPAAESAKQLMDELSSTVGEIADGTATVSRSFGRTEDTATLESRHQG